MLINKVLRSHYVQKNCTHFQQMALLHTGKIWLAIWWPIQHAGKSFQKIECMTDFSLWLFTLRRTVISPKPSVGWMFCWTRRAFMWDLSIEKTLLASQLLLMNYVHALTGKQIAFKYRNKFEKFILQEMLNIWAPAKCRSTELQKFATDVASAVTMEKHLSDHMITKHEATIIEQKNSSVLHSKASILLYKHRLFKSDWGCWIIENGRCWLPQCSITTTRSASAPYNDSWLFQCFFKQLQIYKKMTNAKWLLWNKRNGELWTSAKCLKTMLWIGKELKPHATVISAISENHKRKIKWIKCMPLMTTARPYILNCILN